MHQKKCAGLRPGSVVEVYYPLFRHYAIVSDRYVDGRPTLISLSRRSGRITEEAWFDVTGRRRVGISAIDGGLPGAVVVARARFCMQQRIVTYKLLTFNCEHFVRLVHGVPLKSVQVQNAVKGACIGVMGALILPQLTVTRAVLLVGAGALAGLTRQARDYC